MERFLADTNIFGIAVDPEDDRRESVWETLERILKEEDSFLTSRTVLAEIEDNPHKPTRTEEKELVDVTVDEKLELSEDVIELSDKLVEEADIGMIDAQILATAILNECIFWTGDHELLNKHTIKQIKQALEEFDPKLELQYRIE